MLYTYRMCIFVYARDCITQDATRTKPHTRRQRQTGITSSTDGGGGCGGGIVGDRTKVATRARRSLIRLVNDIDFDRVREKPHTYSHHPSIHSSSCPCILCVCCYNALCDAMRGCSVRNIVDCLRCNVCSSLIVLERTNTPQNVLHAH